jgi:hypothetical protein
MAKASAIVGSIIEILLVQPLKNIPQSSLVTTAKEAEFRVAKEAEFRVVL